MKNFVLPFLSLFVALTFVFPAFAQEKGAVFKPNLEFSSGQRTIMADGEFSVSFSGYNLHRARLLAHRMPLAEMVKKSGDLAKFEPRLAALDAKKLPLVKSWDVDFGKIYPNQWKRKTLSKLQLPRGVYLLRALTADKGVHIEHRAWIIVTNIALLAKRSGQEILIYATGGNKGAPVGGLPLILIDANGHRARGKTNSDGIYRGSTKGLNGNIFVYGELRGNPAHVLSGVPSAPVPFQIYSYTDRPIYRPGQRVSFKGTVRRQAAKRAPGGVEYSVYENKPVVVTIRDATDALVWQRRFTTNHYGSFDGDFALAAEPALGRWQVVTSIGTNRHYAYFDVQAYRKPEAKGEVVIAQKHYLGGEAVPVTIRAEYFSGQPVANAQVEYSIHFSGSRPDSTEPDYNGEGKTNARGELELKIQTQRLTYNRTLSVTATVTPLSRRQLRMSGSTLVTAGLFNLRVAPVQRVHRVGETVAVEVTARDYDGQPVQTPVEIQLVESRVDRDNRAFTTITKRELQTGADGTARASFKPIRPGRFGLQAIAFDREKFKITASSSVWLVGDDDWRESSRYEYPTLELLTDKDGYEPGETAVVLLNTNLVTPPGVAARTRSTKTAKTLHFTQAWALITLEGERLYNHRLVHLTQHSTVLRIPLNEYYAPGVRLTATLVQEGRLRRQSAMLPVQLRSKQLKVTVAADQSTYRPAARAGYTITTRDFQDKPVAAEVGLAVVDEAIYALRADTTPDIAAFFWHSQTDRIETDWSFAARYSGGAYQIMARQAASQAAADGATRVRKNFADTAYWNPHILTDEDGTARVTVTMPDDLTTWRATARGLTRATQAGSATTQTAVQMPFAVRLALPRFVVKDDAVEVSASLHNYTDAARDATATIEATGATLQNDKTQTVHLDAGEAKRVSWRAKIDVPPQGESTPGAVSFLVKAVAGDGFSDAMQLSLPAQPLGLKMVEAQSLVLDEAHVKRALDLSQLPANATLKLTLSASVAAPLFETLDYLNQYPYGSAESTISALIPTVTTAATLRNLKVDRPAPRNMNEHVSIALQRLYRFQHDDGGWNQWEFDQTDGDMTAYVLWGLIRAREAGYAVDEQRVKRGAAALERLLNDERELSRRADWMYTLSFLRPASVAAPLADLYQDRAKLDDRGRASLALALANVAEMKWETVPVQKLLPSRAALKERAQTIAQEFEEKAKVLGPLAHWPAAQGGYSWRNDDAETTAFILRALLKLRPQSTLITPAVRWLMSQRTGQSWNSTKTSAEVALTLIEYLKRSGELQPNFQANVLLDDKIQDAFLATPETTFSQKTVTLTPAQWKGRDLTVTREGPGVLYLTLTAEYLLPPDAASEQSHGLRVRRFFNFTTTDPARADTLAPGAEMTIEVQIEADSALRYAVLEDPLPAGYIVAPEAQPEYSYYGGYSRHYSRREVRDDKIVYFFDRLPAGRTTVRYKLRAETPGDFHVLPSIAQLTYFPGIRGNSSLVKLKVEDTK